MALSHVPTNIFGAQSAHCPACLSGIPIMIIIPLTTVSKKNLSIILTICCIITMAVTPLLVNYISVSQSEQLHTVPLPCLAMKLLQINQFKDSLVFLTVHFNTLQPSPMLCFQVYLPMLCIQVYLCSVHARVSPVQSESILRLRYQQSGPEPGGPQSGAGSQKDYQPQREPFGEFIHGHREMETLFCLITRNSEGEFIRQGECSAGGQRKQEGGLI